MYVGDNTEKDFFAPNQLGWKTVCILNDGRNIHQQDFELKKEFLPKYKINDIRLFYNGDIRFSRQFS